MVVVVSLVSKTVKIQRIVYFFFSSWPHSLQDLSSQTRNKTQAPAVKARSPNHRTVRNSPVYVKWVRWVYIYYTWTELLFKKSHQSMATQTPPMASQHIRNKKSSVSPTRFSHYLSDTSTLSASIISSSYTSLLSGFKPTWHIPTLGFYTCLWPWCPSPSNWVVHILTFKLLIHLPWLSCIPY